MDNDDVPPYDRFVSRKRPTSDPAVPEEEQSKGEEIISERICRCCRQPFIEMEKKVICGECGQYVHVECSNRFDMKPTCNACIMSKTNVYKPEFKILFGVNGKYKTKAIKEAAGFTDDEFNDHRNKLVDAKIIIEKKFLWMKKFAVTYKAKEVFPTLKKIFEGEEDVKDFISNLGRLK